MTDYSTKGQLLGHLVMGAQEVADIARELPNGIFFADNAELEKTLRATASPGDIILTVGAGDVYKIGERLVAERKDKV